MLPQPHAHSSYSLDSSPVISTPKFSCSESNKSAGAARATPTIARLLQRTLGAAVWSLTTVSPNPIDQSWPGSIPNLELAI